MPTVAERVDAIQKEISGVESLYHIDSYDREFLFNAKHLPSLTPKQEAHLRRIERLVFKEGEDSDDG